MNNVKVEMPETRRVTFESSIEDLVTLYTATRSKRRNAQEQQTLEQFGDMVLLGGADTVLKRAINSRMEEIRRNTESEAGSQPAAIGTGQSGVINTGTGGGA